MKLDNDLTRRLGLRYPIVQAPMAGGGDTPALVAAVAAAGGFGFLGAAYLNAAQIERAAREVRERGASGFGINLFAPGASEHAAVASAEIEVALRRLTPWFEQAGLVPPEAPDTAGIPHFDDQLAAAIDSGARAISFTMGLPAPDAMEAIRARGIALVGTATTVEEALQLERAGCDAIVAQGSEAGGHRGSFAQSFDAAMVGTIALVPQIVDAVRVPVIASGGIMDGRGIAAALVLGAQAVQMGTAFLCCDEAGASEAHKQAILAARDDGTRVTRAFSGRPARGIVNRFMQEIERGSADDAILPFPLQNALTRPLRTAAAREQRAEMLSLWCGQAPRLARRLPAARLVERLVEETRAALARTA